MADQTPEIPAEDVAAKNALDEHLKALDKDGQGHKALESFVVNFLRSGAEVDAEVLDQLQSTVKGILIDRKVPKEEADKLLKQLPKNNDELIQLALDKDKGFLTFSAYKKALREGIQNSQKPEEDQDEADGPSPDLPGRNNGTLRSGGYIRAVPRNNKEDVTLDDLQREMEKAKADLAAMNGERGNLYRMYQAEARFFRGPARVQYQMQFNAKLRSLDSQYGYPSQRYWVARQKWEGKVGMSYARHLRSENEDTPIELQKGMGEARRVFIKDKVTDKVLAIYDEWTGDYTGDLLFKQKAMEIAATQEGKLIGGKRREIYIDGAEYVRSEAPEKPIDPLASDPLLLKAFRERGSGGGMYTQLLRQRQVSRELGIDRTKPPSAGDIAMQAKMRGATERGGNVDYSLPSGNYAVVRKNNFSPSRSNSGDAYASTVNESLRQSGYDPNVQERLRSFYKGKNAKAILENYKDLANNENPIIIKLYTDIIDQLTDAIEKKGKSDNTDFATARTRLDALRKNARMMKSNSEVKGEIVDGRYIPVTYGLKTMSRVITVETERGNETINRTFTIRDPRLWDGGIFQGSGAEDYAREAGIQVIPDVGSDGRVQGMYIVVRQMPNVDNARIVGEETADDRSQKNRKTAPKKKEVATAAPPPMDYDSAPPPITPPPASRPRGASSAMPPAPRDSGSVEKAPGGVKKVKTIPQNAPRQPETDEEAADEFDEEGVPARPSRRETTENNVEPRTYESVRSEVEKNLAIVREAFILEKSGQRPKNILDVVRSQQDLELDYASLDEDGKTKMLDTLQADIDAEDLDYTVIENGGKLQFVVNPIRTHRDNVATEDAVQEEFNPAPVTLRAPRGAQNNPTLRSYESLRSDIDRAWQVVHEVMRLKKNNLEPDKPIAGGVNLHDLELIYENLDAEGKAEMREQLQNDIDEEDLGYTAKEYRGKLHFFLNT